MYGLQFQSGEVDFVTSDLGELRKDLRQMRRAAQFYSEYAGLVPVVQVGTNPADVQWETFEDARIEIPDWWWARVAEENE